jgi:hypothetical protein
LLQKQIPNYNKNYAKCDCFGARGLFLILDAINTIILSRRIYHEITKGVNFYAFPNVHEIYAEIELNDIRDDLNGIFEGNGHKITGLHINSTNCTMSFSAL